MVPEGQVGTIGVTDTLLLDVVVALDVVVTLDVVTLGVTEYYPSVPTGYLSKLRYAACSSRLILPLQTLVLLGILSTWLPKTTVPVQTHVVPPLLHP